MAQVFRSLQSYMDELNQPSSAPSTSYDLTGEAGTTSTAPQPQTQSEPVSETASYALSSSAPPPESAPIPIQPAAQSVESYQVSIDPFSGVDSSGLYANLFGGVGNTLQQSEEQARGLAESFNQDVTPFRDYESIGAEDTLRQAIETDQGLDAAKELANASYQGPRELDRDEATGIYRNLFGARDQATATRTDEGLSDLLKQGTSGLTEGERRFESQRLRKDPNFQADVRAYRDAAQTGIGQLAQAERQAGGIAERRTSEEQDIQDRSRQFAGDWADQVVTDVTGDINQALASDEALARDFDAFLNSAGTHEDLQKLINKHQKYAGQLSDFWTQHEKNRTKADALEQRIMNDARYAEIRDIPRMEIYIHKNGRENYRFPTDWYEANKGKYSKQEMKRIQDLARERERALDVWFRPGAYDPKQKRNKAWFSEQGLNPVGGIVRERIEGIGDKKHGSPVFSSYNPSQFGGGLESMDQFDDLRPFLEIQQGDEPTLANMAKEFQRDQYNRAKEILGEADRIEASDPRQAAAIRGETERYIAEEQRVFDEITREMYERGTSFAKAVRKVRKAYASRDDYDWVAPVVGGLLAAATIIGTWGYGSAAAPAAYGLGAGLSTSIAGGVAANAATSAASAANAANAFNQG